MAGHKDRLRCPFCLEEIAYLDDPKQLKCGHVSCLSCLEGHVKVTEICKPLIECPICSGNYEVDALESLPEAKRSNQCGDGEPDAKESKNDDESMDIKPGGEINSVHTCSVCKGKDVMSESYCISCDKKLCAHHEQWHNEFFESEEQHKVISIQKYCEKPDLYTRLLCKDHNKEVGMCCKFCLTLKCSKCLTANDCSESKAHDKSHTFVSLQDVEKQINSEFAEVLKKVSETVTEMCKTEKKGWLIMDEIEEECQRLTKEVESAAKKMMSFVNSLLQRISTFEMIAKYHSERRMEELRLDRVEREENSALCERFLNRSHATKLIEERSEMLAKMEDQSFSTEVTVFPNMSLLKDQIQKLQIANSGLISSGIQHVSTKDIDKFKVGFPVLTTTEDGRIIYANGYAIFLEPADGKDWLKLYDAPEGKAIVSICYNNKNLFLVEVVDEAGSVEHAVLCIKNIFDEEKRKELDVSEVFPFTHYEDEFGSYDPPRVSTWKNMGALTCNDNLVSFDLDTYTQHVQAYSSQKGLSNAAVLPMYHFCTTGYNNIVKFQHKGKNSGDLLVLDNMKGLKLCRWKYDKLLLLFEDVENQLTSFALLNSRGEELSRFSHELLEYCLTSGPICAHGDHVMLFNADRSAIMTFKIDYEKEKD